jgi:hypothetical protein
MPLCNVQRARVSESSVDRTTGHTRTVNPSAYAYSGSNPLPATLVRALFFGSLLRRRSLRCHGLSQLAANYAAPTRTRVGLS